MTTPERPSSAPASFAAFPECAPMGARARLAFALILVLALGLRLTGITFNLDLDAPERALLDQVDERGMVDSVHQALVARDLNPRDFLNRGPGGFVVFLAADLPVLGVYALRHPEGWQGVLGATKANPSLLQLVHRLVSALFGTLTVALLVYVLQREFGTPAALLAGAILAVAYQHVRDSHLGRVDVIWAFFSLLCVVRSWTLLRVPTLRNHLIAGLCCGLALALKYPGGLLVFVLIGAHLLARRAAQASARPVAPFARLAAGLAVVPLGVLLAFPGIVSAWDDLLETFAFAWSHFAPAPDAGSRLAALGQHLRYSLGCGLGWPALGLALAGLVYAWRRGPAGRLLVCATAALTPPILVTSFVAPRLADPLIVLLAGSAGLALAVLRERVPRWAGVALTVVALAPSLARSLAFDWLMLQTDTRVEMLDELARRGLPASEVLAFGSHYSLPRPMQRARKPYLSYYRISFGATLVREPELVEDVHERFQALLADPPRLILWCESEREPMPGSEDFADLVRERYREVLRLDGRREPFLLPGVVGADMLPYDRPWLMTRPGPALVLYERVDP